MDSSGIDASSNIQDEYTSETWISGSWESAQELSKKLPLNWFLRNSENDNDDESIRDTDPKIHDIEKKMTSRKQDAISRNLINGLMESQSSPDSSSLFGSYGDANGSGDEQDAEKEQEISNHTVLYSQFLEQLRQPAATNVLRKIKLFIVSIRLEHSEDDSVIFDDKIEEFFEDMKQIIATHPLWVTDEQITMAIDGVETYVLSSVYKLVFSVQAEEIAMDYKIESLFEYLRRIVTMDHMGVPMPCRNELVMSLVQQELRRINSAESPVDKLDCIVRASSIILNTMSISSRTTSFSRMIQVDTGADDFVPAFFYAVLHAKIPHLWSNVEFIRKFRDRDAMCSKSGYCFTSLQSAVHFFMNAKSTSFIDMPPGLLE